MLQDPLTLYKLIILYMLGRVKFPLTTAQISNFILEKEYTNFLTLQQVFSELTDTGLVESKTINNRTQLSLSAEGKDTLNYFGNRISDAIKEDINQYFRENEYSLREEVSVLGDYYKSTSGEYEAHLIAKEQDINLVELTLSVPTKEIAEAVCHNWQKKNQEVYEQIIKLLF